MCGVGGWFCQGNARPSPEIIQNLLLANMERGTSASGLAYQDADSNIRVVKAKGPAIEFIKASATEIELASRSPRGLIHARATTKGSEDVEVNNHPVAGFGWAVVHNGTITNDDDVWQFYEKKDSVQRFAEVDTSAIPLMLSRGASWEESIRNLSVLGGSFTIAAWNAQDVQRMLLGRFGYNDLYMYYDAANSIMYWSSAGSAGFALPGKVFGRHKFLTFSKLADEHVLLLQPGNFDSIRVFKVERKPFFAPRAPIRPTETGVRGGSNDIISAIFGGVRRILNGHNRIEVDLPTGDGVKRFYVSWAPMEAVATKPEPMHEHFTNRWWNLVRDSAEMSEGVNLGREKFSGYGRWRWELSDKGTVIRTFIPYKRTKDYWFRVYKTKFDLPLEINDKGELDEHFVWEHYDINLRRGDNTTQRFLGFMCPVCGVWCPSAKVQTDHGRCEFCNIKHRLQAKT